ncbi:hypothetical protein [Teichococcus vastitatis]|uniref:Uncharacterized protein n=1 Tax=Teichococcus vastitatis TaxID=2307076 RepID=A0ABS9W137_9PROT|nr:hypothetical protein [Pseudoroseomonas vastitatis]MCI0752753.1 hypothetical protein [Pseudoroseomonas vastitatis]
MKPVDALFKKIVEGLRLLLAEPRGKFVVFLFLFCVARPSDLNKRRRGWIFRMMGLASPGGPALVYSFIAWNFMTTLAFTQIRADPKITDPLSEAEKFLDMKLYFDTANYLVIFALCYLIAIIMFAFHKTACFIIGPNGAAIHLASFRFFLIRACILMSWFVLFAGILVYGLGLGSDQPPAEIISFLERNSLLLLGAVLLVYFLVKFCRTNSELAMQEIYFGEGVRFHLVSAKILLWGTFGALLCFVPRFLGVAR